MSKTAQTSTPAKAAEAANKAPVVIGARSGKKVIEKNPFERIATYAVGGKVDLEKQRFVAEPGMLFCGKLVASREIPSKTMFNKDGTPQLMTLHVLRTDEGKEFGVWGTGQLNAILERVPKLTYVEIAYNGTEVRDTKYKKAQQCHSWSVALEDGVEFTDKIPLDEVDEGMPTVNA